MQECLPAPTILFFGELYTVLFCSNHLERSLKRNPTNNTFTEWPFHHWPAPSSVLWQRVRSKKGLFWMAGQFSFGRDGDSIVHCPRQDTLSSMTEENRTVILTLKHSVEITDLFVCERKTNWSVFSCRLLFIHNLLLAINCMLPWNIYRAEVNKKIWICCWICFQIRTMLSRGIPLALPFPFNLSFLVERLDHIKRMPPLLMVSLENTGPTYVWPTWVKSYINLLYYIIFTVYSIKFGILNYYNL